MKSHFFTLSFMSLALGDISVKILLNGISEIFLLMFSSRTFMLWQFIFKSFIHLEFIFCVWCKLVVEFHLFAYSCPDLTTPIIEEAIFTPFVEHFCIYASERLWCVLFFFVIIFHFFISLILSSNTRLVFPSLYMLEFTVKWCLFFFKNCVFKPLDPKVI